MRTFFFALIIFAGLIIYNILMARRDLKARRENINSNKTGMPLMKPDNNSSDLSEFYRLVNRLEGFYDNIAHPQDLLKEQRFITAVKLLNEQPLSNKAILEYSAGGSGLISCIAYEVMYLRGMNEEEIDDLISGIGNQAAWAMYFAFRALNRHADSALVGKALLQVEQWWLDNSYVQNVFQGFVAMRIESGEEFSFGDQLKGLDRIRLNQLESFLAKLNFEELRPLSGELAAYAESLIDYSFLNSFGRTWNRSDISETIFVTDQLSFLVEKIRATMSKSAPRSILLLGEPGVGKTTVIRQLSKMLQEENWVIFEANASDVLSGQIYIGMLEERLQKLVDNLNIRKHVIWLVPNFHELYYAGKTRHNPVGILESLLPEIERGEILIIGETTPSAFEQLIQQNKRLGLLMEKILVEPSDDDQSLEIAQNWAKGETVSEDDAPIINDNIAREALHLCKQFLSEKESPGNLLDLLKLTRQSILSGDNRPQEINADDLYRSLSHLTGLPRSILDEKAGLNLESLRELFQERVLGQPEAVDCLVERVAMIKTGLTDPTRPSGVFMFAGPTGTGKTEIAKTLAQFLFGSPERMIRLDMSEYQTPDALDGILGERSESARAEATSSLFNQIRKQPFSVILLDEFEKAHPRVWDLFLQVFDDGRLTDRSGNTANFRNSIIILTTNLGSRIQTGESIGFNPGQGTFSISSVEKAIQDTFRREFINRLDRVVIFRPLSRLVMREILINELKTVLTRRGLRMREWAIEWEDSALEFLLDKGFTQDLGARPLKRAIERYLLSPLAMTIINHQVPEGDQFLFVRGDGQKIDVEFIDPDAADEKPSFQEDLIEESSDNGTDLAGIIMDSRGIPDEVQLLEQRHARLVEAIRSESWSAQKDSNLKQTNLSGFWDDEERFSVLGRIEYMDRVENGLKTADSLLGRLNGSKKRSKDNFSTELVSRLAQQIYLLESAYDTVIRELPREAFLRIETQQVSNAGDDQLADFFGRICQMYRQWSKHRRMHFQVLEDVSDRDSYIYIAAVSGFGSYAILQNENGFHVWEKPKSDQKSFQRYRVTVSVIPQPMQPADNEAALREQARSGFKNVQTTDMQIVRRYRAEPSPLVRDQHKNWRTGRIDRVLDGDFDLFT